MSQFSYESLAQLRTRQSVKWRAYDADVIPAWVAEMDFTLAEPIAKVLTDAISRSDTGYAWTSDLGVALSAFAQQRWQWSVDPKCVIPVADVLTGVGHVLLALTQPGDSVVITSPVYPPFFTTVTTVAHCEVVDVPLVDVDGRYTFNREAMREAFSRPEVTAFLACSPHNPTGRVFDRDEMSFIAQIAQEFSVLVVSDEIHAPMTHHGYEFIPYLTVAGQTPAVSVISASKAWNIAGLKCAQVVSNSKELYATLHERIPLEVQFGAGHLGVLAAQAAYFEGSLWLDEMLTHLESQKVLLRNLLHEYLPLVQMNDPQASYLAWLDFNGLNLAQDPAAVLLEKGRVALNSGPTFGPTGPGFARLNFATSPEILTRVIEQMAAAVR